MCNQLDRGEKGFGSNGDTNAPKQMDSVAKVPVCDFQRNTIESLESASAWEQRSGMTDGCKDGTCIRRVAEFGRRDTRTTFGRNQRLFLRARMRAAAVETEVSRSHSRRWRV